MLKSRRKSTEFLGLCLVVMLSACDRTSENTSLHGFSPEDSDPKAIEIADQVMAASGGRENWQKTRYLTWRCFGKRFNVWDKWTGDVRVESELTVALMNLNTMTGRAWKTGAEITDPDELERALEWAQKAWMNDSYWVFAPFKLKDPGVILKYLGESELDGRPVDVVSLTFNGAGANPENKYHIYVDKATNLLVRWDFYMDASDPEPRLTTPWKNYQEYGSVLLSDDRGTRKHTDLAVFDDLPPSVLESPEPVNWDKLN